MHALFQFTNIYLVQMLNTFLVITNVNYISQLLAVVKKFIQLFAITILICRFATENLILDRYEKDFICSSHAGLSCWLQNK